MNKNYIQGKMSKKELENRNNYNSPKGESFHDSQTESDSINPNQKSSNIDNTAINDNNNISEKIIKEEQGENIDNIAYDKKCWNVNDMQYSDLFLRREATNESKCSIDTPDISKQHLKELLNEDLLNALEVSPMVTPKNMLKDPTTENINENNNENIIPITDDMMNGSNNDLFQFSLYSNNGNNNSGNAKNEKESNINNNNNSKNNPIDELIKISENNEDKNKNKNQKEEEDFNDNGIMDSFIPSNLNMNSNIQSPSLEDNTANVFNNDNTNNISIKDNDINNKNEIINIKEDEGGGGNNKKENLENKNNLNKINNNTNLNNNNTNNLNNNNSNINNSNINIINNNNTNNVNNNNSYNKFSQSSENKKETEVKKNNNNTTTKTYIPSHMQNPYIAHIPFPYQAQQHIIQALQSNIHENKFDGNKKFNIIIPMQPMKKNTKMKKPFEIRDGDWTCSDCGNLNFAFRVRCNRCGISKEASEEKKSNNNDSEQKHNNTKDNSNNNNSNNNTNNNNNINNPKNYYPNMNMMQYKGLIFQNPLYNKGEAYYPKYYSGFIYVPVQGNYMKDTKEKKVSKEDYKNTQINKENKEKENFTNNLNNNKKSDDTNIKNEKKEEENKDDTQNKK